MSQPAQLDRTAARVDLLRALEQAEADVTGFFGSLTDDEFEQSIAGAWSPELHLLHLCLTIAGVARGLSYHRLLLRLRFGRARTPPRSYVEMRDVYIVRLGAGVQAPSAYVPRIDEGSVGERRAGALDRWGRMNTRMRTALAGWSERQLDRIRLPHPLLGPIATRELIFLMTYHDYHHIEGARRRLPRFALMADSGETV